MEKNNSSLLLGDLLTGRESYEWLLESILKVAPSAPINICSAFIKYPAIEKLLARCPNNSGRVLVRWQKFDLCIGSSDISIFGALKARGWRLYMDTSFHGKIYSLPGIGNLMGSANATNSGFSMSGVGNSEVCTILPDSTNARAFIDNLFSYSTLVDDQLFDLLCADMGSNEVTPTGSDDWSINVIDKLKPISTLDLLVCDFFKSNPELGSQDDSLILEDLELIGISSIADVPAEILKRKILKVKSIAWLVSALEKYPEGIYFGELTALLHNALMEDPTPYRSTVKILLANTLGWLGFYCADIVLIDRPNHSQRIKLQKIVDYL